MPDTFGGEWHRPRDNKHHDRQVGRSKRELEDRASFDHEPAVGCGALFLLCILTVGAALGLALV